MQPNIKELMMLHPCQTVVVLPNNRARILDTPPMADYRSYPGKVMSQMRRSAMSDRETSDERKFRVVDRRFWAEGADQDENEASEETTPQKPSYVIKLETDLEEKRRQLEHIIASHKESLAEFQRAKERLQREAAKEANRIKKTVINDFLEVLDNLERALDNPGQDATSSIIEGVWLVRNLFVSKLESHGVTKIEAHGVKFDPQRHEAITTVPTDDPNLDGIVMQVVRDGYMMNDEILRPVGAVVGKLTN